MPIVMDLGPIDELTKARSALVNQPKGRPPIANGQTLGIAVQRASIVMMSAVLQSFVEDVFLEVSKNVLPHLTSTSNMTNYRKSFSRVGNPNPKNIARLFLRLGIDNVLNDLSWQKCANLTVRRKLDTLNQLRNSIAHGSVELKLDGKPVTLRQDMVTGYRNFVEQFGERFEGHVMQRLK